MSKPMPKSRLEHLCQIDFTSPTSFKRQTGIICTIGPKSRDMDLIVKMIEAGMCIARLNLSHGSHEYHAETIQIIRNAVNTYSENYGFLFPLGIAADIRGPEIRTGFIDESLNGEIEFKKGEAIRITTSPDYREKCRRDILYIDYVNIVKVVKPGNKLCINSDNDEIILIVDEVTSEGMICVIERGGLLRSRKTVVLPGVEVDLPAVSDQDVRDLKFSMEHGADIVFASFIRNGDAPKEIRKVLGEMGKDIKIISKIQSEQGLHNLNEIISASDGIIISRSALTIELAPEKIFLVQKAIISKCNKAGKAVICATQMIESMLKNPHPTSAEITDIANVVLDGIDCIMLSNVTSQGNYPLKCVQAIANICSEAEVALWSKDLFVELIGTKSVGMLDAAHGTAIAAVEASIKCQASAIICITSSGRSAYLVAKYKPRCPIIAVTRFPQTARQGYLYRGIVPCIYNESPNSNWIKDVEERIKFAFQMGKKIDFIKTGDPVVIVTGWKKGSGKMNTMRIDYAYFGEELDVGDCVLKYPPKRKKKDCANR